MKHMLEALREMLGPDHPQVKLMEAMEKDAEEARARQEAEYAAERARFEKRREEMRRDFEERRALMAHHERLAAASRQEARVTPNAAEVLELLAQAIEARRDRQKCGTSFDDLVEQLDPAYLRSLTRPARAPRWAMAAR